MPPAHVEPTTPRFTTRRVFLGQSMRGAGLLALGSWLASPLLRAAIEATGAPRKHRSILVLVQLAGGNDGLNTVIPFADDRYYQLRPTLGIRPHAVLPLDDQMGLHPACGALHELFHSGQLAIVQNVGYPDPSLSHFHSSRIWATGGECDGSSRRGWLARLQDHVAAEHRPHSALAVHFDRDTPLALQGGPFGVPAAMTIDGGFRTHDRSTSSAGTFGDALRQIAAMIAAGHNTRLYHLTLSGFDTHRDQAGRHHCLLHTLSEGLGAFQTQLKSHRLADQVLTVTYSEFGRSPAENDSHGTNHGTAAPMFLMGSRIIGGLHGHPSDLPLDRTGHLQHDTDFRSVYTTVLEDWMHCPATAWWPRLMPKLGVIA